MKVNEKLRDFVKSLENNQFSKEQEAMLLVRNAGDLQAGDNRSCENRSSLCDDSVNRRRCTNGTPSGCQGSINGNNCSRVSTIINDFIGKIEIEEENSKKECGSK